MYSSTLSVMKMISMSFERSFSTWCRVSGAGVRVRVRVRVRAGSFSTEGDLSSDSLVRALLPTPLATDGAPRAT